MRGGRVQELYKNKGDRNETTSHRGILVQDLPGAMHASFLKRDIDEHYMKFIHETQCGCAKGRGTCMAGQIVELAANFSKGRGKCWGRLYLDLSAVFDSRGILVQDLPGAMHASFLKRDIDEHYMKFIHETQCGCAKGRGTCMAGQIVELAANFSKGRGKCWGRLYLDLSAAFDSILREFPHRGQYI